MHASAPEFVHIGVPMERRRRCWGRPRHELSLAVRWRGVDGDEWLFGRGSPSAKLEPQGERTDSKTRKANTESRRQGDDV